MELSRSNILPDELILEILEWLGEKATGTFSSLTMTCKRFRNITEPFLYKRLEYIYEIGNPRGKFIHSVARRPALARHVRHIRLEHWQFYRHPLGEWEHLTDLETRQAMFREADNLMFRYEITKAWKRELADDVDDAKFALLILMAKNLQRLEMNLPYRPPGEHLSVSVNQPWVLRLIADANAFPHGVKLHGFKHVRQLGISDTSRAARTTPVDIFWPFFCLPRRETLLFSENKDQLDHVSLPTQRSVPSDASLLQSLKLFELLISSKTLAHIFHDCSGLRVIKISFHKGGYQPLLDAFDLRDLEHSLGWHADSLEYLDITFPIYGTGVIRRGLELPQHQWPVGQFSSFRQFHRLRVLKITSNIAFDPRFSHSGNSDWDSQIISSAHKCWSEILPDSINKLVITPWRIYHDQLERYRDWNVKPHLRQFVGSSGIPPFLTSMQVFVHDRTKDPNPVSSFGGLIASFDTEGTKLEVHERYT
jgi:hypothetical protein